MNPAVSQQIWNYIGTLGVDQDTALDLYQEARTAIWQAATFRATHECQSYLVKTGVGAIRHWLRDRYGLIRIPAYLHDRGEVALHAKAILPLDELSEASCESTFEDELLDRVALQQQRTQVWQLLHRLPRAERGVMAALLSGKTIRQIADERRVGMGSVYTQRSKAIARLRRFLAEVQSTAQSPPSAAR